MKTAFDTTIFLPPYQLPFARQSIFVIFIIYLRTIIYYTCFVKVFIRQFQRVHSNVWWERYSERKSISQQYKVEI